MTEEVTIDDMVSDILEGMRPRLTAALRSAMEVAQQASDTRYADKIAQAARLLSELSRTSDTDIPIGSVWTQRETGRAASGTVKPRVLELIRRDTGASVSEIEALGIKPNSIRGTLYSLQKDDLIQRRGDRWYAFTLKSNEAPAQAEAS